MAGESWLYFYGLGVVVEVIVLAFILRAAWTWPQTRESTHPRSERLSRAAV